MRSFPRQLAAFVFAVGFVLPSLAFATNGYFAIGYGMKNRGMAGVAVADPKDSLATTANPAGMAFVGSRLDIGARLFIPKRQSAGFSGGGGGGYPFAYQKTDATWGSGATLFMVPNMGANVALGKWSVGFAMVGNGGMSTRYNKDFLAFTKVDDGALGVSLMQVLILPTVTYKVTPTQAFGIAPILAAQVFRAYGLASFEGVSIAPNRVTNNGNDWSYGAGVRVGWMGKFLDGRLALGATYATRVYMSPLTKYKGLFADGGDFDIPRNFAVGIAVKPIRRLMVGLDVQRIFNNEVHSIGNRHPACSTCRLGNIPPQNYLGVTGTGMGFGWRDQTAYKLGVSYELSDQWTVRGGFDYGRSPVPTDQLLFNVLAPGIVTRHWTGGFTYHLNPASEVSGSFMFAPRTTQICAAPACQTMVTHQRGDFIGAQMWQYSLGISYGLKF